MLGHAGAFGGVRDHAMWLLLYLVLERKFYASSGTVVCRVFSMTVKFCIFHLVMTTKALPTQFSLFFSQYITFNVLVVVVFAVGVKVFLLLLN